jgi:uncharacterized protein (TIGR02147 family)
LRSKPLRRTVAGVAQRAPVDVFRFADYRAFLRAFYEQRKRVKRPVSLRGFSRRAGLRSPNYLKLVMDGDRNLTPELALRFAEACGLTGEAIEYFCTLVAFNQARSSPERELHYARLRRFRRYRDTQKLDVAQYAYHAEWFIPAIRELSARRDFVEDPAWIAKTLLPAITASEARKGLAVLLELGLLVRGTDGRLSQAEPLVGTPSGPLGHHVARYHRTMMLLAAESIDRVPREEREIASLTLCIEDSALAELKAELEQFEQQLLQRFGSEPGRRVVQINFQLFPLTIKED